MQIYVPAEDDCTQDLTLMEQSIWNMPDMSVFVRTIPPPPQKSTSEMLSRETSHQVCYMPEFLTERIFLENFRKQTMVLSEAHDLLTMISKDVNVFTKMTEGTPSRHPAAQELTDEKRKQYLYQVKS